MNKKYQVFISSTFVDLESERKVVTERIIEMGLIPSAMEMFPATSTAQLDYISKVIDDCDYYVLIVGGRYGSTTDAGISYTESEYDYAVSQNKYVLAFVHADPGSFPVSHVDSKEDRRRKFHDFRSKVSAGRIVKMWRNSADLASATTASLHHAITDSPGIGWVRGDEAIDPATRAAWEEKLQKVWALERQLDSANATALASLEAIRSMFSSVVKPATSTEIQRWLDGCHPEDRADLEKDLQFRRNILFANSDFILPPLHGAAAVTVIVEVGVRAYKVGDGGHSQLLFLEGFRRQGRN